MICGSRIGIIRFRLFASLVGVTESLSTERDKCLNADCVKNLLQSGYRHGLVFRFLVTADYLFTHTEPAGEFSLRDSLCNSHLCYEGRDLIQAFDVRKR